MTVVVITCTVLQLQATSPGRLRDQNIAVLLALHSPHWNRIHCCSGKLHKIRVVKRSTIVAYDAVQPLKVACKMCLIFGCVKQS